jgi:hypothetical protein
MDACTFGHIARKEALTGVSTPEELKTATISGLTTIAIVAALIATWASDRVSDDMNEYDTDHPLSKLDAMCSDDGDATDDGDGGGNGYNAPNDDTTDPCNPSGVHSAIALIGYQFFAQASLAAGLSSVLLTVM